MSNRSMQPPTTHDGLKQRQVQLAEAEARLEQAHDVKWTGREVASAIMSILGAISMTVGAFLFSVVAGLITLGVVLLGFGVLFGSS